MEAASADIVRARIRTDKRYAHLSGRARSLTLRRCSSGRQPDVSPVSASRHERREELASPHEAAPFPWIFYARNPLFPLPRRQCTMGRTLVIGQQIQNGIR